MENSNHAKSFSRLSRNQKIQLLTAQVGLDDHDVALLRHFWPGHNRLFQSLEKVSENVISHFYLPFAIAPGFLIDNRQYYVPMVIEESSVVAAASAAAKFWLSNGGFNTNILNAIKVGQIHFNWDGPWKLLKEHIPRIREKLIKSTLHFLGNMSDRGGGLLDMEFIDYSKKLDNYFQIKVLFDTVNAMGANIINTCLETMARALQEYFRQNLNGETRNFDLIMAILSNHTPECLVECNVECKLADLQPITRGLSIKTFVHRFQQAISIAQVDIYRAATHNKGIMNGIDAALVATGNDYRAAEAGMHSYAAKDGAYKGLTGIKIRHNKFSLSLKIPLAIGTVGGLIPVHPLVRTALKILRNPSARELMQIAASVGLACNFSAVRALITSGIQHGHMSLHLHNILTSLSASETERKEAVKHFENLTVSYKEVETFLANQRLS